MKTAQTHFPAKRRRRRSAKRKGKKPGEWIKQISAEFVLPDKIEEIEAGGGGSKKDISQEITR